VKKKINVRHVLFVLFMLVMVTGPGPVPGKPNLRVPGCRGAAPPPRVVLNPVRPPLVVPIPVPPVKPPPLPPAPPAIRPEQPATLTTLQEKVRARDWRSVHLLSLAEAARPHAIAEVTALRRLGEQSGQLEALETLGRAAGGDWPKVHAADVLEAALAKLPPDLRADVRKYLVSRARLEGNSGLARELQRGGEPPDAPTILRDLTALAEEPRVRPPPAQNASPLNLGPEAPKISLRPEVREELGKGLPELKLDELPKVELVARIQVRAKIDVAGSEASRHLKINLDRLAGHQAPLDPWPACSDNHCVVCSPDGQWVVYSDDGIHILEAATLRRVAGLEGHTAAVTCLAFAPDSKTMISGDANGTIRIWRFDGPKTELQWDLPNFGPHAQIELVRVAPDGRSLLVVLASPKIGNSPGRSNLVRLWDLRSELPKLRGYLFFDGSDAFFGADGKTVITVGTQAVKLWDATRWPSTPTADGWVDELARSIPWWLLIGITFVPIAVVVLYFLDPFRRRLLNWEKYWKAIGCAAVLAVLILLAIWYFLPNGEPIATIPKGGGFTIATIPKDCGFTTAALAPDGRTLALHWNAGKIHLYQVGGGKDREPTLLEGHVGPVRAMAFSPDGKQLAARDDTTIHVWMLGDEPTKRAVPRAHVHVPAVTCVAFTSDGRGLVSGSIDKTVRLWDLTGEQPREKSSDAMRR
jgi:WD40 repeat protein